MYYFNPKNKNIEQIFNRLTQYPFQTVDPKVAQTISRYKAIRRINQMDRKRPPIVIRKGTIGLRPNVKIQKVVNGFKIDIF